MDKIKTALKIGYAIQCTIIFISLIGLHTYTAPFITQMMLIFVYFINFFMCSILFSIPFRKKLRELSPDDYNYLYGNRWSHNSYRFMTFATGGDIYESDDMKKLRFYLLLRHRWGLLLFLTMVIFIVSGAFRQYTLIGLISRYFL